MTNTFECRRYRSVPACSKELGVDFEQPSSRRRGTPRAESGENRSAMSVALTPAGESNSG
jgi:hypothetical protein